jgi:predicted PurR-regulated permease PerM
MTTSVNAQSGQIMRWVLITTIIVLVFIAMWLIRDILMLTLTAIIFAVLLTTPVRFFVRRGIPRPLAVLLTIILLIALIALATALLMPGLIQQFGLLISDIIPKAAKQMQEALDPAKLVQQFPFLKNIDLKPITDQITTQFLPGLANATSQLFPFVGSLASTLLSILIVVFLALYFIADPGMHERGLIKLLPVRYRTRGLEILGRMDKVLRGYLQAQIALMILIGAGTGIALWIIGMPLAGVLGTLTGLLSFVPNFGPLVALLPILAVAMINTPDKIGLIIVVYYVLQFVQTQIVAPLLMGQEINLPPAIILLSQIVAGIFFGFLGLLISVPLAAIAMVLVQEIYIKDVLGDVGGVPPGGELDVETDGV